MEQLDVLLRREDHYRCLDYFSAHEVPAAQHEKHNNKKSKGLESLPAPVLMSMLHECASLVTDPSSSPIGETEWATSSAISAASSRRSSFSSSAPPTSPSSVAAHTASERQKSTASRQEAPLRSTQDFVFWREQMCNWAFVVVNNFDIEKETVSVAFNMLDRYVVHERSIPGAPSITREDYQLFAMTALYIAVKVLEPYPRKIAVDALVVMSRDFYSEEDILHTERDMLQALGWNINAPTVLSFSRLYLESIMEQGCVLAPQEKDEIERICSMLSQQVVADSFFVPLKDSMIGLACLKCATHVMGIPEDRLQPLMKQIRNGVAKPNNDDTFEVVLESLLLKIC